MRFLALTAALLSTLSLAQLPAGFETEFQKADRLARQRKEGLERLISPLLKTKNTTAENLIKQTEKDGQIKNLDLFIATLEDNRLTRNNHKRDQWIDYLNKLLSNGYSPFFDLPSIHAYRVSRNEVGGNDIVLDTIHSEKNSWGDYHWSGLPDPSPVLYKNGIGYIYLKYSLINTSLKDKNGGPLHRLVGVTAIMAYRKVDNGWETLGVVDFKTDESNIIPESKLLPE